MRCRVGSCSGCFCQLQGEAEGADAYLVRKDAWLLIKPRWVPAFPMRLVQRYVSRPPDRKANAKCWKYLGLAGTAGLILGLLLLAGESAPVCAWCCLWLSSGAEKDPLSLLRSRGASRAGASGSLLAGNRRQEATRRMNSVMLNGGHPYHLCMHEYMYLECRARGELDVDNAQRMVQLVKGVDLKSCLRAYRTA